MCHTATSAAYDRPLVPEDIPIIAAGYEKCLGRDGIDKIVSAITDYHTPQPAVLIALLEMVHRAKHNDCGIYPWPMMPFSALDLNTLERVQTDEMVAFHTVFESMALAERNMDLLNKVLNTEFGQKFFLVCDCGCGNVDTDFDIFETEAYQHINAIRSLAESVGTKVVHVSTFSDSEWANRSLDMGPTEIESYQRIWKILNSLPRRTSIFMEASKHLSFLRKSFNRDLAAA